jgi:type I restriction enzyme, R subunit
MIEKEILYYNFIERELVKKEGSKTKEYKHNDGRLISPRPKQKFGTDKIINKINEFLEHENEPDYFINKLEKELKAKGIGETQIKELIAKRLKYQNNKNVYSLLLQYAAGFGKSNIIGWTALQLKDYRKEGNYVYDKVMLVVDRLQLRDQLDTMLHNMNIQKGMFLEASDKKSFSLYFGR